MGEPDVEVWVNIKYVISQLFHNPLAVMPKLALYQQYFFLFFSPKSNFSTDG